MLHGIVKRDLRAGGAEGDSIPGFDPKDGLPMANQTDDMLRQILTQSKEEESKSLEKGSSDAMLDTSCKVREISLKILHQAWKAWFDKVEQVPGSSEKW